MKIYEEIVRNTVMGVKSVDNLLQYTDCDELKNVMLSQKEVMEDFLKRAGEEMSNEQYDEAAGSKVQHTMLKMGVAMEAMLNRNSEHIAKMLIDGYNMGIVSMQKCVNDMKDAGLEVPVIANDLLKAYDRNIKKLREYL